MATTDRIQPIDALTGPRTWVSSSAIPAEYHDLGSEGDTAYRTDSPRDHRAPVNRLPPEILVQVFVAYARTARRPRFTTSVGWRELRAVCRHWDNVIRNTPLLWRVVDVRSQLSWLMLCLQRSANIPLDVVLRGPTPAENIALLLGQAHRIRLLHMNTELLEPLSLTHNLPLLEVFELEPIRGHSMRVHVEVSLSLQPSLHSLALRDVFLAVDPRSLSRLRKLELTRCRASGLSVDQFVGALSLNTHLEHLDLTGFLDALSGRWDTRSASLEQITLPRLTVLRLQESHSLISTFLSCLHLPLATRIELEGLFEGVAPRELQHGVLSSMLPPATSRRKSLPLLPSSNVTQLKLTMYDTEFLLRGEVGPESSSLLSLCLLPDVLNFVGWDIIGIELGLFDLFHLFGSAPIRRLSIIGNYDTLTVAHWDRLFASFPALEELTVSASGSDSMKWRLLWLALSARPDSSGGAAARCPRLSFIDVPFMVQGSHELFQAIVECLKFRAENGERLKKLNMSFSPNAELHNIYVPQIRELVEHVECM